MICWSVIVPGNRSKDLDDARGMVGIDAQQPEMFLGCLENDNVVVFGVLRDFLSALRNRSVLEQSLARSSWIFVSSSFLTAWR